MPARITFRRSLLAAGIHFRFATQAGLRMGEQIGRQALGESLTPASR